MVEDQKIQEEKERLRKIQEEMERERLKKEAEERERREEEQRRLQYVYFLVVVKSNRCYF